MAFFNNKYESGERNGWKFPYTGGELAETLQSRLRYHTERAAYWRDEATHTEERIRTSGIHIEEFGVTGGSRFEAKIDHSLGTRLSEARDALKVHDRFVDQYLAFQHEFNKDPKRVYELQLGDLRFFGVLGEPEMDA